MIQTGNLLLAPQILSGIHVVFTMRSRVSWCTKGACMAISGLGYGTQAGNMLEKHSWKHLEGVLPAETCHAPKMV